MLGALMLSLMLSEAFNGGLPGPLQVSSVTFNFALLTPGPGAVLPGTDTLRAQRLQALSEATSEARAQATSAGQIQVIRYYVIPPTSPILKIIYDSFQPLGEAAISWAERVAYCESRYRPTAVNPVSGASGLFQFMPSTWATTPYASQSIFDPVANSEAAAWLYQRYGPGRWSCQ